MGSKGKIDYSKMDLSDSAEEESEKIGMDDIEENVEKRTAEPTTDVSDENAFRDSISYPDSDSDSEPGLTIAEETEDRKLLRSSESESENKEKNEETSINRSEKVDNQESSKDNQASKSDNKAKINKQTNKVDEQISVESKDEELVSKNDLTKELLKNIVSTLDPKEATKLLEKTSMMSKEEKMS